MKFIGEQTSGN